MFPQWGNTFQTMDPSQQMYWQQYYGYQQGAPMWGNAQAPQPGASGAGTADGTQAGHAGAAALPPEPPKDEAPPPPLPADPPPPPVPEEPQPPPDSHEQQKLTALQQQAAQWQQQKQWQEYQQSLLQYQQQLQQWNAQQANILEQINQEEKEFEMQYSDWMKQYNDWKEQNKNHPNRDQYLQYEQQWKQYEEQMAQKREFIKQRKTQALMNQQMAQAPATNASGFGANMDQGVSAGIAKPPESKPELVTTSSASGFASSGFGGGMIYTSSGGQPLSACPPSGPGSPYSGYGYGASDYNMGQGGAANPRFPQPPGGQASTAWPDHHAGPPAPPQGTDQSNWNQPTSMADYGMKHPAGRDFGMHAATSEYEGQRQTPSSDFGGRNPGQMGFGMGAQQPDGQMGLQSPHGSTDPNAGKPRSDFNAGSDETQNFMRKMGMPNTFPGNFRNENQPGNRFQQPDMNARFPGPRGPGMQGGMFDSGGGRPSGPHGMTGPHGMRMPQQDSSMSHGPSATSGSDSSYPGYGQGTDFSNRDANMPWGSANSASGMPSYDANASHFMGPPRFPGPNNTSQRSSEFDSRGSGPMGARMPASSQQSNQYSGLSSSEQSKPTESGPFYPGMSGPRFPPQPPNAPDAASSSSGFPGNRFESGQQTDARFPGPRMPNKFNSSNQPQNDSEHAPTWSDESQNSMQQQQQQQSPGANRFPGPRGPGMGPDFRHNSASGQFRFSGPFGSGMRPDNDEANSGGMRYPGPRGPGFNAGFQQEQNFGNSRFPGPRGPGSQQDFQQDRGFGDTRFPRPHGPGMGPDNQQQQQRMSGPGMPRFPGSQGPRMGSDLEQDASSGEEKFPGPHGLGPHGPGPHGPGPRGPGPRGPGPRPEFGSMERFPRPRGPDFQQDQRFRGPGSSGPFGPGSGPGNQQGGGWLPRSSGGMDSGPRFSQQGPRGPNNFGPNEQHGQSEMEKKFAGAGPPTSGPRPMLTPPGAAQSSAGGVKTSAYEPFGGRGISTQAGSRMPHPTTTPLMSLSLDGGKKPELKGDGSKDAATSKASESTNKPDAGPNKESSESPADASKIPNSSSAFPSSSKSPNFQPPGQGVRPSVGSQGLSSTAPPQKFDSVGPGVRPPGPRAEGPGPMGLGVRPSGPRAEGPGPMGPGVRPSGPRTEGPGPMGLGPRPPGPRTEGPGPMGPGVRSPGPRAEGLGPAGFGVRPSGPRAEGPGPGGFGTRPSGPRTEGPGPGGFGARPSGPRAEGPGPGGFGARPSGPRTEGPGPGGFGARPSGPRTEGPGPGGFGARPLGPRAEGPGPGGFGVRPSGPRAEGPGPGGFGVRPSGPRAEGSDPMGRGIRPPGPSAHPRFPGGPDARAGTPGPRGLAPDAGGMKFTKWQAPGGPELEEVSEEVEEIEPEFEHHHAPFGFDPRGRAGFGGGPRFPAPHLMPGIARGMRPPFPRGPDPRFRPRMQPGVGPRMQDDMLGRGSYPTPADPFAGEESADYGAEEQEDFSQDFGEDGFFGKRKGEEVAHEFGTEESYEEEGNPPASKFGRMDPGLRPPFPRMPAGGRGGFGPRGQRFDAPFGAPPMGMRPRFDPASGRMVRPPQFRGGGPVPLMQLSLRPSAAPISEQAELEDAVLYGEEEYVEELDAEGLEAEAEVVAESGRFMHFGPRGPPGIRGGLPPRMMTPFGPRGGAPRWPRPHPGEEFHPGMGRGRGHMRGPFPGFGNPRMGFPDDGQRDYSEEAFLGLQPPDAMYDEEGNPVIAVETWGATDYAEEQEGQEIYDTDDPNVKLDSDGAPIQFSEREHELIKKAAEELKLLSQTMDPLELLASMAPGGEKPKPPSGNAYPKDEMRDETEEALDYEGEREYLDRDDRFLRGKRLRGRFHEEPSYPEEEYGAEQYASDAYGGPWHEEDRPRRPGPPDMGFRGPVRDFEPEFHEPPWREDPEFHEGRFPRNPEEFDRPDRRPFEGRWGPPPDWDRRSPQFAPERGSRGPPLPPLPNPREFLENLEGRPRPPSFGHGPPPRPPPFDAFPPASTSEVFDYGHGEAAAEAAYDRRSQNAEPEEFWPDRDEDMRLRAWERDRDLRHEREVVPGDRERRAPPFPDVHERGNWPEHRERDFPGSHDRERGSRNRDLDSRSSSDRGSREPSSWNREHRSDREREPRDRERDFRDHDRRGVDRDEHRDRGGRSGGFEDHFSHHHHPGHGHHGHQGPPGPPPVEEPKLEVAAVDDILVLPGRRSRPDHIVVIIRGPPGAGKTYVSRLLKDKEVANGGTAPRMLCLDDYFMVETEKMVDDPETRKKTKKTVMEYEYDPAAEPSYKLSFLKSFKRQIDDCYFNFIVVDAIFDKTDYLDEFWSYAKSKGFQVYVVEMQAEIGICAKRNTHQRKQSDIQKILDVWDETPRHYIRLDVRSLLQDAAIEDVEMEDTSNEAAAAAGKTGGDQADEETEEDVSRGLKKSKWEMDTSEQQLDKLDGIRAGMKKHEVVPQRLEDYLQLPDDYDSRKSEPGKKRVRWADIEERKDQLRRRELGFVIGQTDWAKMTDDSYADRALNRTKYF